MHAQNPMPLTWVIGMQLTNIARDVQADALIGRRYLPMNWTKPALVAWRVLDQRNNRKSRRVSQLLALADQYYDSAMNGLGYLPVERDLPFLWLPASMPKLDTKYAETPIASGKVGPLFQLPGNWLLRCWAIVDFLTTPRLHRRGVSHDETLHRSLASCAPYGTPGTPGHDAG